MEEEEKSMSEYIEQKVEEESLPTLFGRRRGYSNPTYPCFFHIYTIGDIAVEYLDDELSKEFEISLAEIKALGTDFLKQVVHPEDVTRVIDTLNAFAEKEDESETLSFFQRIKLKTEGEEGYRLVLTSVRLDLKNQYFLCISNSTDQLPIFTKKICNALNTKHEVKKQSNVFLSLTKREKEIMQALFRGKKVKDIADSFNISSRTVEQHKKNLYKKINVKSVAEVIAFASLFY